MFNFLTQGCERLFIFYILTFCIQKFNSLKLAPEPPKGDKMEKERGRDGRAWEQWERWERWERWEWWEVMGGRGRAWERWEGVGAVGDSPRTPEGGQAASGGTSNW